MPNNPKVSIIIPIYNTAKYLPACLNSIKKQTYKNLEIILVDDGSTDSSGRIADKYAAEDSRVTVIHQPNAGQSAARNIGLAKATGKYISFVDSDDEIKPTFIEKLLSLYGDNTSIAACGHEYHRVQAQTSTNPYNSPLKPRRSKETQEAYILKLLAKDGRLYSCNNKLFLAKIIHDHHLFFDEKLNFAEDTKFVLTYLKYAKGEIAYTPSPLYIYNSGTATSTMRTVSAKWSNWQASYRDLKSWLGPHPTARERFWLYVVYLRWHISYLRSVRRARK
ncbi:glycosyltransferase [Candidatus Saccharibacteria bacterium]|nr:glycosyltransferase [Candidatus Saccharibacteria bacterium]